MKSTILYAASALLALTACGGTKGVGEAESNTTTEENIACGPGYTYVVTNGDPSCEPAGEAEWTPPPSQPAAATPSNFAMAVKLLSQECYGSAGCNIEFRAQINAITAPATETGSYEITYEVGGLEDGPLVNTVTITDGEYSDYDLENFGSVSKRVKSLPIKVTAVETL